MVKNIGPQLARVPGIAGATVLGNGEVVLILNPLLLVNRVEAANAANLASGATPVPTQAEHLATVPVVMVVDNSLTVRKSPGVCWHVKGMVYGGHQWCGCAAADYGCNSRCDACGYATYGWF